MGTPCALLPTASHMRNVHVIVSFSFSSAAQSWRNNAVIFAQCYCFCVVVFFSSKVHPRRESWDTFLLATHTEMLASFTDEIEALISRLSAHRRHIDSLLFSSIVNLLWTWSVHASMHNICRQRSTLNGSSGILIGIAQTLHSFLCCSQICYSTFDAPYFG